MAVGRWIQLRRVKSMQMADEKRDGGWRKSPLPLHSLHTVWLWNNNTLSTTTPCWASSCYLQSGCVCSQCPPHVWWVSFWCLQGSESILIQSRKLQATPKKKKNKQQDANAKEKKHRYSFWMLFLLHPIKATGAQ